MGVGDRTAGQRAAAAKIVFDRRLLWHTLAFGAMLCWPLLLIGRPAYFPDSLGYYSGGRTATAFVVRTLMPSASSPALRSAALRSADTKATRSIEYGVLAYVLGGDDAAMTPLAVFQALLAGFLIAVTLAVAGVAPRRAWAIAAVIAVATPAAWVACLTVPDIFAGLLILAVALLLYAGERLGRGVMLALGAVAALAVAAHTSHLAIAASMGLVAAMAQARRRTWRVALPAILGVALVGIGGLIGFGEFSLAPKRYPLTLARSIDDGPGRWYLARHCATEHFAVCEVFGPVMPPTSSAFLWGPGGVMARATPAQLDRIRAEETRIVIRAAAAYPSRQVRASLHNIGRQLVNFRVVESDFDVRIVRAPNFDVAFASDPRLPAGLPGIADALARLVAVASLAWLGLGLKAAAPERRRLALLIVFGLFANAAVCAVLSAVSDRYQARVIWLLPLAAALVPAARWPGRAAALARDATVMQK